MSRVDELLEYLGRKGCALSRSRIREDLRWPEQELDAVLTLAMRDRKIRAPRPGEYEIPPRAMTSRAGETPIPPAAEALLAAPRPPVHQSRAMTTEIRHKPTEETTMPIGKRPCAQCKQEKGNRAFKPGADVCNECKEGGKSEKPAPAEPKPRGRRKAKRLNGKPRTIREVAERHASNGGTRWTPELLRAQAAKFTAAAVALEALG